MQVTITKVKATGYADRMEVLERTDQVITIDSYIDSRNDEPTDAVLIEFNGKGVVLAATDAGDVNIAPVYKSCVVVTRQIKIR